MMPVWGDSTATERTADVASIAAWDELTSEKQRISILVSLKPVALLVDGLLQGERQFWQTSVLVPPESSLHDFRLTPSAMAALKSSAGLFWIGPDAEPGVKKLVQRFPVRHFPLSAADLEWVPSTHFEDHDLHLHGDSGRDPHIWLSLPQLPIMFKEIAKGLEQILMDKALMQSLDWSQADVEQARMGLQRGLARALSRHEVLLSKARELRKTWAVDQYISFHDAYGYLDAAFDINSLGSFVQNPEDGIAPRQIRELQRVIQSNEVGCFLTEPFADGREPEQLLSLDLPVVDFDITSATLPQGLNWVGYWEYILEQMQACFGSDAVRPPANPSLNAQQQDEPVPELKQDQSRIRQQLERLN